MPFWRCCYHIIWTTKHRASLITPDYEPIIFHVVRDKTAELGGEMLAVNAVSDHVHVAVTIPPKVAVAEWVKRAKGVSAYEINQRFPDSLDPFRWQDGYGVLTFGAKNLDTVVSYIQRQKEHHAHNDLLAYLEQVE
jgi:putative transposase